MKARTQQHDPAQQEVSLGLERSWAAASEPALAPDPILRLQRAAGNRAVEQLVQARRDGPTSVQAPAAPPGADLPMAGPGMPLEPALRQDMEQRFDRDLSQVRVHVGDRAAESAAALGASAYAYGQHIVFGRGRFDPASSAGQRLVAHELAHTIQQRGSGGELSEPEPAHEREADRAAGQALDGGAAPALTPSAPTVACQLTGEIPWRIEDVDAQIWLVRQQLQLPVQPLRGPLLARLQALEARRQQLVRGHEPTPESSSTAASPDPVYTEQEIREGELAYYASTRQARLDLLAERQTRFRDEVPNMTPKQIDAEWDFGQRALIYVASSPDHKLDARQLFTIWKKYWIERRRAADATVQEIEKREAATDRRAFVRKMVEFHEHNERDVFGSEYRQADDIVVASDLMFRVIVDVHELLIAAENQGKSLTLQQINEHAIDLDRWRQAWVNASGMVMPRFGARGGLRSRALAKQVVASDALTVASKPRSWLSPGLSPPAPKQLPSATARPEVAPVRAASGERVGDIVNVPGRGPHRVVSAAPNGDLVLQPLTRSSAPPSPARQPQTTPPPPQAPPARDQPAPGSKRLPPVSQKRLPAPQEAAPTLSTPQRIQALAKKKVIVGMQARITVSGKPVQEGLQTARFSLFDKQRAAALGGSGQAAVLPQVSQPPKTPARKGSQPSAGLIVQPAPQSRELEVLAWNTSAPEKGHNVSHAERQFINWFEGQDPQWRGRVTEVNVTVYGRDICTLCAADLKTLQANHPHIQFKWVRGD